MFKIVKAETIYTYSASEESFYFIRDDGYDYKGERKLNYFYKHESLSRLLNIILNQNMFTLTAQYILDSDKFKIKEVIAQDITFRGLIDNNAEIFI